MTTAQFGHRIPDEPHGASVPLPHHAIPFYFVFGVLVVLTGITVGVNYLYRAPNEWINVGVALMIAFTKGTFVARYFMHLKFEGKLIYLIFLGPLLLCILLIAALLPDIAYGRVTAFNDIYGWYQHLFPAHQAQGPY